MCRWLTKVISQIDGVWNFRAHAAAVSGRARQLNHRLKNRKSAIISRRQAEDVGKPPIRSESPPASPEWVTGSAKRANGISARSQSPPQGFTAVNTEHSGAGNSLAAPLTDHGHPWFSGANTDNVTVLNGASIKGVSQEQRAELIKSFFVNADTQTRDDDLNRQYSRGHRGPGPCRIRNKQDLRP